MMSTMADELDVNLDLFPGWEKEFGWKSPIHDREGGEVSDSRAGDWVCRI